MRMAIAPISSVSFKNNSGINFTSRVKNDSEGQEFVPSQRKGTTDLAKMPVIVLLAMTPAMAEGETPKMPKMGIMPAIEVAENKTPEADEMTYIISPITPETQQSDRPFGYERLKYEKIHLLHEFNINGKEYSLVFSAANKKNGEVDFIYIIPKDSKGGEKFTDNPPQIYQLIYHDIGKDKEYCGAIIEEDIIEKRTGKYKGTMRSEMRLPDETAQKIIDLVTGHSNLKNNTLVKIKETTNPMLMPPKVYE